MDTFKYPLEKRMIFKKMPQCHKKPSIIQHFVGHLSKQFFHI